MGDLAGGIGSGGIGDFLRRVRPGDRFLEAASFRNATIEAILDYLRRSADGPSGISGAYDTDAGIIRISNTTGSDQTRFAVVILDAPAIGPAANLAQFQSHPNLNAIAPTGTGGAMAILLDSIAGGAMGRALVSGVSPVILNCGTNTAALPRAEAGTTTAHLENYGTGSAEVLWADTPPGGGGTVWAMVRIGAAPPPVVETFKPNVDWSYGWGTMTGTVPSSTNILTADLIYNLSPADTSTVQACNLLASGTYAGLIRYPNPGEISSGNPGFLVGWDQTPTNSVCVPDLTQPLTPVCNDDGTVSFTTTNYTRLILSNNPATCP